MSVILGNQLTPDVFERLNGKDLGSKAGKAIILVTVDENGRPHPAMLSYYEVVAKSREHIDLAVGKTSTTARNLRQKGAITLLLTDQGMNFYLKGRALEVRASLNEVPFMSLFRVHVEELLEDQEPDAVITSGVTFHRPERKDLGALVEKLFRGIMQEA